jgi:preprotein translocase subunit SecF
MLEIIPHNTKIPFMKYKGMMIIFSFVITSLSLFCIIKKGFNYGVDFAGGVQIVLNLPEDSKPDAEKLRKSLESGGLENVSVQSFGTRFEQAATEYIVHFPTEFSNQPKMLSELEVALGGTPTTKTVVNFRFVGLEKAFLTLTKDVPLEQVQKAVRSVPFGFLELVDIQKFGRDSANEYQLSFQSVQATLQKSLSKDFVSPSGKILEIKRVDFVGAKVGHDLKLSALFSLIITAVLIFVYIFIRFNLTYAPGVVIAGVHDVLVTAGAFSYLGMEFDLTTVAALLTLAGYSINDTIIVYDRIREVAGTHKGKSFSDIIDLAANQTLSRTIITSFTVFIVSAVMYVWGGPVIHGFSFALCVGVIVGTYSSVFVAAPAILAMEQFVRKRDQTKKKAA